MGETHLSLLTGKLKKEKGGHLETHYFIAPSKFSTAFLTQCQNGIYLTVTSVYVCISLSRLLVPRGMSYFHISRAPNTNYIYKY